MHRFSALVAAVLTAITAPAVRAEPRGRSQASTVTSPDDGDGPEARAAALLKLDDIIEVAVRLSPDIARARTDREIAQSTAGAARREQAWILSASANYERDALGADSVDNGLAPLSVLSDDKITGSLGLGRKLPTGGEVNVELGLTHERQELNITGETLAQAAETQAACGENVDIFCKDQAIARLSLKQPLLRGLGADVALASERKADLAAAQATLSAQLAAEEMLRDVISAYWELAYAAQEVDIRLESLELAKKQDQLTRQEMRAGTAAQSSLDAVGYEIAMREGAALTAKLELEKKSLELRRKSGLEIGRRDIVVRPKDPLELDTREWDVEQVLAASHKINRQLATVVLEKKLADVDVDVAHDQTLPQIDLNLSGALTGTGDTGSSAFSGVGGGDGFGYQVTAGVTMSFELSGAAKAAHSAAVSKRHRLDIERVDLERKIDAEVVSAVKVLISGRTRVALADKAIGFAEDNVKAERANFLAQRSTNFQVMQRQAQLADARISRARAVADHQVAVAQLQYLSGTLLDAYRIRVRPRSDGDGSDELRRDDARPARTTAPARPARTMRSARN
jgi:outer membrane protein